jgi:hypothetical protein
VLTAYWLKALEIVYFREGIALALPVEYFAPFIIQCEVLIRQS